jgi:hypothetical protein
MHYCEENSMTNRLMISVAAVALLAGTGLANAQGTGMGHETQSATPSQQSSPSEHGATSERGNATSQMNHESSRPEMKSENRDEKSGMNMNKNERAEEKSGATKNQRAEEKSGANKNERAEEKSGMNKNQRAEEKSGANKNERAEEKSGANKNQRAEEKSGVKGKETTTGQSTKSENREESQSLDKTNRIDQKMGNESEGRNGRHSQTTGQAGAGAKLSTEQRTKITTVIKGEHVAPVEHVNFSLSVGTRVPRDVRFHTLPTEVVSIYPEWRGYEYILVGDQVVVIDPQSYEIVAVLDA